MLLTPKMTAGLPQGFLLQTDFISMAEETALLEFAAAIPLRPVRMHGVESRRRVAQYGWRYSFESYRLTPGEAVPAVVFPVRERAAALAEVDPLDFSEVLITEYAPGAGIGWHRDAPHFGMVAGLSLGSACRMRLRRGEAGSRDVRAVELPARSIYLLTGSARSKWEHMIPPVPAPRWSITFRTLRRRPLGSLER